MTITADEVALLEAVAAELDDDEPRRAYAAWLVSRHNDWGRFILQSLEPPPSDPKARREHDRQLEELRKAHAKAGLGPVYSCVENHPSRFHRGFPIRVGGDARWIVRAGRELVLRAPRAELSVHDLLPRHIEALAPVSAELNGDQLTTIEFDEPAFLRLAEAGILSRFRQARLLFSFGAPGVAALVRQGASLRNLALGHVADPTRLFESQLPLDYLSLASDRLSSALARYALTASTLVASLEDFDDDDVDRLLAAPSAQHLDWLGLSRSSDAPPRLTGRGALRLAQGLGRLRVLNLGGTWGLDRETAAEIAAVLASR